MCVCIRKRCIFVSRGGEDQAAPGARGCGPVPRADRKSPDALHRRRFPADATRVRGGSLADPQGDCLFLCTTVVLVLCLSVSACAARIHVTRARARECFCPGEVAPAGYLRGRSTGLAAAVGSAGAGATASDRRVLPACGARLSGICEASWTSRKQPTASDGGRARVCPLRATRSELREPICYEANVQQRNTETIQIDDMPMVWRMCACVCESVCVRVCANAAVATARLFSRESVGRV